jgi:2,3-bisphosphoglycerate-independent phosphoglycerate mutase
MGNSEVGHLNLGSGRIVWESLPRIDFAIEKGDFAENKTLNEILEKAINSRLHLIGLTSTGGVHSHLRHLEVLLSNAKNAKVENVFVHFISDGRDTQPKVALHQTEALESKMKEIGVGKIATVIGRYFAMDRDKRWDRTEKAYKLYTAGVDQAYSSAKEAIESNYKNGKSDEFIEPSIIDKEGAIKPGDAVVFFNFRADRMRQIVAALTHKSFDGFERTLIEPLYTATMTEYDTDFHLPTIFSPINLEGTLADAMEGEKVCQYHVAETEKYPHVTYFLNGGRENPHELETQFVVPSPKVATYDLKPEMSAQDVKKKVLEAMNAGEDFVVVNFANGDMVGHTGVLPAAVKGCEAVDIALGEILKIATEKKYYTIITADHGNCEVMIDESTGEPYKEHTTNPVPFVYIDPANEAFQSSAQKEFTKDELLAYAINQPVGVLSDVAPSILSIMGVKAPSQMAGVNLAEMI